jgi:hypothetical protein
VDQYAKYLGRSTDRTHVITQALEIALAQDADFQKTLPARPAAPAAGGAEWPLAAEASNVTQERSNPGRGAIG